MDFLKSPTGKPEHDVDVGIFLATMGTVGFANAEKIAGVIVATMMVAWGISLIKRNVTVKTK